MQAKPSCTPQGRMHPSAIGPEAPMETKGTQPAHTKQRVFPVRPAGAKEVQVRLLARGEETVLGDAASDSEVFLTTELETR